MLKKEHLEKLKTVTGFDVWQTEKDYLQHLFLLFLSRYVKTEIVFKGGTALQKAYGLNRFSVDLDFTLNGDIDIKGIIDKIISDFKNFGFMAAISKYAAKTTGSTVFLKIHGPLYDGREKTEASMRVEISSRENVLSEPFWKEIVPVYEDLQPYIVHVMRLEEILAEKIRAVVTRGKARDLYDLWFLILKGVKVDEDAVSKKLKYYGIEFGYSEFEKSVANKESVWKKELKPLIKDLPAFETVKTLILSEAKKWSFRSRRR